VSAALSHYWLRLAACETRRKRLSRLRFVIVALLRALVLLIVALIRACHFDPYMSCNQRTSSELQSLPESLLEICAFFGKVGRSLSDDFQTSIFFF
jgi:hypothetical protein